MKSANYFLLLLISINLISCKKYLDVVPDNVATIEYAFRNRLETENYLFTCYSTLQGFNNVYANVGFTGSGEISVPPTYTGGYSYILGSNGGELGFQIIRGAQNLIAPAQNFWDGENQGLPLFRAIRRCNIFLENINVPVDITATERQRWAAEVKFLKAYYHYWLARMYGPIPVVRENLPINASPEEVRVHREHVDTVFNYVVKLLDEAIADLPETIFNETQEMGRITRMAAMAVKAEVRVTQASPLFNGNSDYAGFKGKNGEPLMSTSVDPQKWTTAAEACREAIEEAHARNRKLYTFTPTADVNLVATDSTKQLLTLQGAFNDRWNAEIIWSLNTNYPYPLQTTPRLTTQAETNSGIHSILASTLKTAEMFYTKNGVPIDEDVSWNYGDRYGFKVVDSAHRYYVKLDSTTINLHLNRERRFYANLGFDLGIWFGNGVTNDNQAIHLRGKGNQTAGAIDIQRTNFAGYWAKKLISYRSAYTNTNATYTYRWPMMRLASLYLLYAEALNESSGPSQAYEWINRVRDRAGLKTVQESWSAFSSIPDKFSNKEGLRDIIRRERKIELCFEGQAGWDIRRWKTLLDEFNRPLLGWNITGNTKEEYYQLRPAVIPSIGLKNYLWPLKDNNLAVNPNLVQTLYW